MKRWLPTIGMSLLSGCFAFSEPSDPKAPGSAETPGETGETGERPGTQTPGLATSSKQWPSSACRDARVRSPLRIMAVGDSITHGPNGSYRSKLRQLLGTAGPRIDFVGTQTEGNAPAEDPEHEGYPGRSIGDIAALIDNSLSRADPDVVSLMIGTNDVAWWSARSATDIGQAHAELVDRILAARPNVWLVIASIPPLEPKSIEPNDVDRAQLGREYNAVVRKTAESRAAQGKRVWFVDAYSALTLGDLTDGVHPGEDGHAKVARLIAPAIEAATKCE